jgi:hypothetical protein
MDTFLNFAECAMTGIALADTTINLAAGEGARFPNPGVGIDTAFNATIWNATDYPNPTDDPDREIVRCTARSTDALAVTRAQEGTISAAHNTAGKVYKFMAGLTAKTLTDISDGLAMPQAPNVVAVFDFIPVAQSGAITSTGGLATYHQTAHNKSAGDYVWIASADQAEYNGWHQVIDVPDVDHFTYTVSGSPASPSTGTSGVSVHVYGATGYGLSLLTSIEPSGTTAGKCTVTFNSTQATSAYPVLFTPGETSSGRPLYGYIWTRATTSFDVRTANMGAAGSTYTGEPANGNTLAIFGVT